MSIQSSTPGSFLFPSDSNTHTPSAQPPSESLISTNLFSILIILTFQKYYLNTVHLGGSGFSLSGRAGSSLRLCWRGWGWSHQFSWAAWLEWSDDFLEVLSCSAPSSLVLWLESSSWGTFFFFLIGYYFLFWIAIASAPSVGHMREGKGSKKGEGRKQKEWWKVKGRKRKERGRRAGGARHTLTLLLVLGFQIP